VERIIIEGGAARGVEGKFDLDGKSFDVKIKSKVVVAACGSIKTPALLLKSGVRGKNVGRHLRLHPTTAVTGRFEQEVRAWEGPPQTVVVTKFLNLNKTGHGFWMEAAPAHPGLFALSTPWGDGKLHKDFMKERFNHSTANIVLLKEWGSGLVKIDKYGSPVVSYELDGKDKDNLMHGIEETAKILAAGGAIGLSSLHSAPVEVSANSGELSEQDIDRFSSAVRSKGVDANKIMMYSAHLMGSCRMSISESLGAVDSSAEVYGVRNLFVSDASVFPTALGANPMITIMAMSKRTSRFVARRLREISPFDST
jgi:choline dehydrogenase-like flavoprotein